MSRIGTFFTRLLTPPSTVALEDDYRAYTTEFDHVLAAQDLPQLLGPATSKIDAAEQAFKASSAGWLMLANTEWVTHMQGQDLSDMAVTILLDHSGSMRGQRMVLARAISAVLVDGLGRLGAQVEVLGFTTASWKGGSSRLMWLNDSKPTNPGRLCDLLHVVYREFSTPAPGLGRNARYMFHPELFKENIDGEALLWATDRNQATPAQRRIILVVSDGAPVDDSTLQANGPNVLHNHLKRVVQQVQAQGITLAGIGLDHDTRAYYPHGFTIKSPEDIGGPLANFMNPLLRD